MPLFDIRNIPLHIYTLFMMPPNYYPDLSIVRPSPYGLSIFLTSPAFIYAFFVKRKTWLTPACWLAIGLVTIPLFMHYSQGWVQYGYRFMLDYMPFLAILTVMGFDDHQSQKARALPDIADRGLSSVRIMGTPGNRQGDQVEDGEHRALAPGRRHCQLWNQ